MKKIGFIGLGVMGTPMVKNLLKVGYTVVIYDIDQSRIDELVSMGAEPADSPKDIAGKSEVIIIMVGDSPDVEQVVLGTKGIIENTRSGLIVIDMSSISPFTTRRVSEALAKKDVKMLDAPVSGGDIGAKEGTLSIMVGGSKQLYEESLPIFRSLGKQITYMGEIGSGQSTKLCNQVICGLNIQAVCEGLMLGVKLGLDMEKLLQVVTAGYANSRILSHLGPKMVKRDFEPGFKMRHQLKDLKNALNTASQVNLPLPATSLITELFRAVQAAGLGEKGTQAAILTIEKLAGKNPELK